MLTMMGKTISSVGIVRPPRMVIGAEPAMWYLAKKMVSALMLADL